MSSDPLPAPQIDGVVWDQAVIGDTVYVGGSFTTARPAGAAPGTQTVPRSNFLAYDLNTGVLLDYAPGFNASVRALSVSPDGKRLYVGGAFTSAAGSTRYRLAAFDSATGKLIASFAPVLNASVWAITVTDTTVYVGGAFTSAQKTDRSGLAAFSSSNGSLTQWAPLAQSGTVNALVASPDGSKIVIGGRFTTLNGSGNPGRSMGAVRADDGRSLPWKANETIRNGGENSGIYSLSSDGESLYGAAFLFSVTEGNFEGTFRASWADGSIEWMTDCHGDSYSIAATEGVVYTASHAHYCGGVGGFPEGSTSITSDIHHRALAFSNSADRRLAPWNSGGPYGDFAGQPAPTLLDWYPDLAAGSFTGMTQAAFDVTVAKGFVLYAGEFTRVNGTPQQGLVRFAPRSVAPNADGPQLRNADMKPRTYSWGGTYAKVQWATNYDRDDAWLTYQVIRDGNTMTPVFETTVLSRFWHRKGVSFVDGYLTPGKTYSYRIRTVDPHGNVTWGDPVAYTAPDSSTWGPGYLTDHDRTVLGDQPVSYWPMNEPGDIAHDWAFDNDYMTTLPTVRIAGPEPSTSSKAVNFTDGSFLASNRSGSAPQVFSLESSFSTTSTNGGQIVGFADSRTPSPSNARDRIVQVEPDGRVSFYVFDGSAGQIIRSERSYNDGSWHSVTSSLSPEGMELYVDGELVASNAAVTTGYSYPSGGFWHVGGLGTATSSMYTGAVDNVALFDRRLSAAEIREHHEVTRTVKPNAGPSASFTAAVQGLDVSLNGAESRDSDGKIVSYAWSFGDGSSGMGTTTSHHYSIAGTYTVQLTVTDDRGGTASTTRQVVVDAGAETLADDRFNRTTVDGWGAATTGGAWKLTGSRSGFSTADSSGRIRNAAGEARSGTLPAVNSSRTDSSVSFRLDAPPSGGGQYVSLTGRQVGSESYLSRVWVQANGVLQLQVLRGGTVLSTVNLTGVLYKTGDVVNMRLQVSGIGVTTMAAKAWTTGTEPLSWQLTTRDSTVGLQAAGSVGLGLYVSSSGSVATVSLSKYRVISIP